jgi:hypothetical protein
VWMNWNIWNFSKTRMYTWFEFFLGALQLTSCDATFQILPPYFMTLCWYLNGSVVPDTCSKYLSRVVLSCLKFPYFFQVVGWVYDTSFKIIKNKNQLIILSFKFQLRNRKTLLNPRKLATINPFFYPIYQLKQFRKAHFLK